MVNIDIQSASPQWAVAAMQIFQDELAQGNINLCKKIYADVLDAGHYRTAREMKAILDKA